MGYYRTRRMARCPIGTDRHISPGLVGEHKGVCIMLVCVGGGRVLTCGYGHGRTATSPHALRPGHSALRHRCCRDYLPDLPRALARHLRRRSSSHLRFTPPHSRNCALPPRKAARPMPAPRTPCSPGTRPRPPPAPPRTGFPPPASRPSAPSAGPPVPGPQPSSPPAVPVRRAGGARRAGTRPRRPPPLARHRRPRPASGGGFPPSSPVSTAATARRLCGAAAAATRGVALAGCSSVAIISVCAISAVAGAAAHAAACTSGCSGCSSSWHCCGAPALSAPICETRANSRASRSALGSFATKTVAPAASRSPSCSSCAGGDFFTRAGSFSDLSPRSPPATTAPPCAAPFETRRVSAARRCSRRRRVLCSPAPSAAPC